MSIFLDSGDFEQIAKFYHLGIIRGVTSNPSIMKKDGVKDVKTAVQQIATLIDPYPVSVEVTTNNYDGMIEQAREFKTWATNINVKIPIHGPEGEYHNLQVIKELYRHYNVTVNATAMMSAQQGFLAALAGARYVSLFGGRIADSGHSAIHEIKKLNDLLLKLAFSEAVHPKIIVGSVREVSNIVDYLLAGADIVTTPPDILEKMIVHARTKETVKTFLDDSEEK